MGEYVDENSGSVLAALNGDTEDWEIFFALLLKTSSVGFLTSQTSVKSRFTV